MYKKFEAYLRRNKIVLCPRQKVMAMAIMSVMDLYPDFLRTMSGKTALLKWIDSFFDSLPHE